MRSRSSHRRKFLPYIFSGYFVFLAECLVSVNIHYAFVKQISDKADKYDKQCLFLILSMSAKTSVKAVRAEVLKTSTRFLGNLS